MKKILLFTILTLFNLSFVIGQTIVINETDADTPGTDAAEFIELFDGGAGNTALDGYVLVLFNGNGDVSYAAYDLDGYSTDGNGYFVIGAVTGANADFTQAENAFQNGADAVALYLDDATNFPEDTPVTTNNLKDAIVYDTNDADDAGLLVLLNSGEPQVNEDGSGDKDNHSLQRSPNGSGGLRNTSTYIAAIPTPGAANVSLTGTLTLTYPNGGETFNAGDDVTLTWTSSDVDNVRFEVLSDEGWDSFIEGPVPAAGGSLLITIPANAWDWDGYKVRIVDYAAASIYDESDAAFTINGHDTELFWEDFSGGTLGNLNAVSVLGDQVWDASSYSGKTYAKISGYDGANFINEDWLITNSINLDQSIDEILEFYTVANFTGADLAVKYSTNYDGQGDPSPATWTEFSAYALSPGGYEWVHSGYIDVSGLSGNLYVAFIYTSTDTDGKTWEVTEIFVSGINDQASAIAVIDEKQVKILPNPFGSVMNISTDKEVASVVFFNMVGQIANKAFVVNNTVSTASLTNGMYIVQIIFADGTVETQKVIKR